MLLVIGRYFTAVLIALSLVSVSTAGEIVVEKDIEYRKVGSDSLKLNIARPKDGDGPFPCIVWIHGGGWAGGNRGDFQGPVEMSAQRGFVAATISYRFHDGTQQKAATKNTHPAQVHDCKAAIRWLRKNADKYQIDPNGIGVIGASAGGHLSLMLGLTEEKDGLEEEGADKTVSSRVQAVVNIFGPTEMVSQHKGAPIARYLVEGLCGGTPESASEAYKSASPLTYLTQNDPPILTFHGTTDNIVPVQQAKLLDEKCKEIGVAHELKLFEGQGHGFDGKTNAESGQMAFDFFGKHLKTKP
jgi:acetyl esterase/lipase